MSALHWLSLGENRLTSLPLPICELTGLQVLHVQRNQLNALPDALGDVRTLRVLWLGRNPIEPLPITARQLPNLIELKRDFKASSCPALLRSSSLQAEPLTVVVSLSALREPLKRPCDIPGRDPQQLTHVPCAWGGGPLPDGAATCCQEGGGLSHQDPVHSIRQRVVQIVSPQSSFRKRHYHLAGPVTA